MRNPIKTSTNIRDGFMRYVESAFHISDNAVSKERRDLLEKDGTLSRVPYIEPLPEYVKFTYNGQEINFRDLTRDMLGLTDNEMSQAAFDDFKAFASKGLMDGGGFALYTHQVNMLTNALKGRNCVVTTGTGSGKTESFLLPLFAQIAKEMQNWGRVALRPNIWATFNGTNRDMTGRDGNLRESCRQRGDAQVQAHMPAVRALIIYPMNALVEDQIRRLRKALDYGEDAQSPLSWFNQKQRHIYFGRYNAATPVAGRLYDSTQTNHYQKCVRLREELSKIDHNYRGVKNFVDNDLSNTPEFQALNGDVDKEREMKMDHLTFFQRLDGTEMYSRQDMQLTPPDILITNFSMLSIMLMRADDGKIWDQTKRWLDGEDLVGLPQNIKDCVKKERIFHLVIDELHLHRGTSGTEVAYLLRMLYDRLGIYPGHPQLRILASSASLEPEDELGNPNQESYNYLKDFFKLNLDANGIPDIHIESGDPVIPARPTNTELLDPTLFASIAEVFNSKGEESDEFATACENLAASLANQFHFAVDDNLHGASRLVTACANDALELKKRLFSAFDINGKGKYRAISSYGEVDPDFGNQSLARALFGDTHDVSVLQSALDGLFIIRSYMNELCGKRYSSVLPRLRNHLFFRNYEGLWASCDKNETDQQYASANRTVGRLYMKPKDRSDNGSRVLEMLYCEHCGSVFFGGYRAKLEDANGFIVNNGWELLPNYPELEKVPSSRITRIPEDRTYNEFAIFWPKGSQEFIEHADVKGNIRTRTEGWTNVPGFKNYIEDNVKGFWKPAYLDSRSGKVYFNNNGNQNLIEGYIFTVHDRYDQDVALGNNDRRIKALPCTCPACGTSKEPNNNTRYRQIKLSPIRGFHTGFHQTSQLLADELINELSTTKKRNKLVVFSDSREAAARISSGIEKYHYVDMLREYAAIQLRKQPGLRQEEINVYNYLRNGGDETVFDGGQFESVAGNIIYALKRTNSAASFPRLGNLTATQYLSQFLNTRNLIKISDWLESPVNAGLLLPPLYESLIQIGVNPAGYNDISTVYGTDNWTKAFDFNNISWQAQRDPEISPQVAVNISNKIYEEISRMFSGRLYYSFEAMGLGFISCNSSDQTMRNIIQQRFNFMSVDDAIDIINGCLRIWLELFKHIYNENNDPNANNNQYNQADHWPAKLRRWISNVEMINGYPQGRILNALYEYLFNDWQVIDPNYGLKLNMMYIDFASSDTPVYWNKNLKIPHLHRCGGVCTTAGRGTIYEPNGQNRNKIELIRALKADGTPMTANDVWQQNYLAYNVMVQERVPNRLHCEEMTGQTDDQFMRQRQFRDIILANENRLVDPIDLLSVTTTLEVGVDIGSLQTVMLADMPPQRFNYQQRVGRAGRRGQAFSYVLTLCKGQSHDEYYFSHPMKITGDKCPTPFLSMGDGNEEIARRVVAKAILREIYLSDSVIASCDDVIGTSDIHGEFGSVLEWKNNANHNSYRQNIIDWLTNNVTRRISIVDSIVDNPTLSASINNWLAINNITGTCQFVDDIDGILADPDNQSVLIGEKLAEGGFLPLYGMPTSTRNLFLDEATLASQGIDRSVSKLIDRDSATAIYEFAPGAQKTKDKKVHTAIGFAPSVSSPTPFTKYFTHKCPDCGCLIVKTEAEYQNYIDNDIKTENCSCGATFNPQDPDNFFLTVIPHNYLTDFNERDSLDEMGVLTSKSPTMYEPSNGTNATVTTRNSVLSFAEKSRIWSINDNNGDKFNGRKMRYSIPNAHNAPPLEVWCLGSRCQELGGNFRGIQGETNRYVQIGDSKVTNVVKIGIENKPNSVDINMFNINNVASTGIKSAYYSAAFIIQRTLSDYLDVDPEELVISEVQKCRGSDSAEIILSDALPNGSGFVKELYNRILNKMFDVIGNPNQARNANDNLEFLQSMMSDEHIKNCNSACYSCVRVFRNMSYHAILDWRLGLCLLRLMQDRTYVCGTDFDFDYPEFKYYNQVTGSMENWLGYAERLTRSLVDNYYSDPYYRAVVNNTRANGSGLWYITKNNNGTDEYIFVVHPLWMVNSTFDNGMSQFLITEIRNATSANPNAIIKFIDTFNLDHRQSWCKLQLG